MPKDPNRNRHQYRTGGGQLNEAEFEANQAAIAEEEKTPPGGKEEQRAAQDSESGGAANPRGEAARVAKLTEEARDTARRRREKMGDPIKE